MKVSRGFHPPPARRPRYRGQDSLPPAMPPAGDVAPRGDFLSCASMCHIDPWSVKLYSVAQMKRAYIRVSKATPAEPQEAALREEGGFDFGDTGNVWRDDEPRRRKEGVPELPWRARVIQGCRAGDEVVVENLAV